MSTTHASMPALRLVTVCKLLGYLPYPAVLRCWWACFFVVTRRLPLARRQYFRPDPGLVVLSCHSIRLACLAALRV